MTPEQVVGLLVERGFTVATAESLTGGLVCAALTSVPGSSAVVRGGVVAYATDLKVSLLGVEADLVAERGAVDAEVARQMAAGVCRALSADFGVACTGVAGPDGQDGHHPGHVFIAVHGPEGAGSRELHLEGGRAAVREATVLSALALLAEVATGTSGTRSGVDPT